MEGVFGFVHPFHSPLGLLPYHVYVWNCFKEKLLFIDIFDVGIYEERVGLAVDVLHGDLEAIEAPSLRDLDLWTELLG